MLNSSGLFNVLVQGPAGYRSNPHFIRFILANGDTGRILWNLKYQKNKIDFDVCPYRQQCSSIRGENTRIVHHEIGAVMTNRFAKSLISSAATICILLGVAVAATPASAATLSTSVASSSSERASQALTARSSSLVASAPTAVKTANIPYNNVFRIFTSIVECEALVPVYAARYFPAFAYCIPTPGANYLIVIRY
ncbi:hypothetical protein [Agreia sp. COWG]|uniref:hypothetical protein n=1 Tax=Agreia sp. COWG TaxID=2773266 RepID=UPI00192579FC|nr:hypothetical protein [Agreia sp. COWG]CAD6016196.1 protein of unknown function [Agreia sp. COWG]